MSSPIESSSSSDPFKQMETISNNIEKLQKEQSKKNPILERIKQKIHIENKTEKKLENEFKNFNEILKKIEISEDLDQEENPIQMQQFITALKKVYTAAMGAKIFHKEEGNENKAEFYEIQKTTISEQVKNLGFGTPQEALFLNDLLDQFTPRLNEEEENLKQEIKKELAGYSIKDLTNLNNDAKTKKTFIRKISDWIIKKTDGERRKKEKDRKNVKKLSTPIINQLLRQKRASLHATFKVIDSRLAGIDTPAISKKTLIKLPPFHRYIARQKKTPETLSKDEINDLFSKFKSKKMSTLTLKEAAEIEQFVESLQFAYSENRLSSASNDVKAEDQDVNVLVPQLDGGQNSDIKIEEFPDFGSKSINKIYSKSKTLSLGDNFRIEMGIATTPEIAGFVDTVTSLADPVKVKVGEQEHRLIITATIDSPNNMILTSYAKMYLVETIQEELQSLVDLNGEINERIIAHSLILADNRLLGKPPYLTGEAHKGAKGSYENYKKYREVIETPMKDLLKMFEGKDSPSKQHDLYMLLYKPDDMLHEEKAAIDRELKDNPNRFDYTNDWAKNTTFGPDPIVVNTVGQGTRSYDLRRRKDAEELEEYFQIAKSIEDANCAVVMSAFFVQESDEGESDSVSSVCYSRGDAIAYQRGGDSDSESEGFEWTIRSEPGDYSARSTSFSTLSLEEGDSTTIISSSSALQRRVSSGEEEEYDAVSPKTYVENTIKATIKKNGNSGMSLIAAKISRKKEETEADDVGYMSVD